MPKGKKGTKNYIYNISTIISIINLILITTFFIFQQEQNNSFYKIDKKQSLESYIAFRYDAKFCSKNIKTTFKKIEGSDFPVIRRTCIPCMLINNSLKTESIVDIRLYQNELEWNSVTGETPKTRLKYYKELEPVISIIPGTSIEEGKTLLFDLSLSLLVNKDVWESVKNDIELNKEYVDYDAYEIYFKHGYADFGQSEFKFDKSGKFINAIGDTINHQQFMLSITFGSGMKLEFPIFIGIGQNIFMSPQKYDVVNIVNDVPTFNDSIIKKYFGENIDFHRRELINVPFYAPKTK
jgi:hypothetical protein